MLKPGRHQFGEVGGFPVERPNSHFPWWLESTLPLSPHCHPRSTRQPVSLGFCSRLRPGSLLVFPHFTAPVALPTRTFSSHSLASKLSLSRRVQQMPIGVWIYELLESGGASAVPISAPQSSGLPASTFLTPCSVLARGSTWCVVTGSRPLESSGTCIQFS